MKSLRCDPFEIGQIPQKLADKIETELLSSKPKWTFEKATCADASKAPKRFGQKLVNDSEKFSLFLYQRNLAIKHKLGTFENDIESGSSANCHEVFKSISPSCYELVQHIRNEYLEQSLTLVRAIANIQVSRPENNSVCAPHFDRDSDTAQSFLYYVNQSDGGTFFSTENGIHSYLPQKGTFLSFKSKILHAGAPPSQNRIRATVNIVFDSLK